MTDLVQRLRDRHALCAYQPTGMPMKTHIVPDALCQEAADRIEADAALMQQALAYILSDGDFLNPDSVESTRQLIAALRARLPDEGREG